MTASEKRMVLTAWAGGVGVVLQEARKPPPLPGEGRCDDSDFCIPSRTWLSRLGHSPARCARALGRLELGDLIVSRATQRTPSTAGQARAATEAREARPYVSCEGFVEHCNWRKGRNQRKKSMSIHSRDPARLGFRGWALARALGRLELAI